VTISATSSPVSRPSRSRTPGAPVARRRTRPERGRRVCTAPARHGVPPTEAWTDLDLVIDRVDGEPFPPDSLSRDWYRLVHRIGLPDLRLHDLRHAFATRLLEASVHPKVVSEALGHSSVAFTMDTYQHLMPTMQEQAVRAIEEAIGGTVAAGSRTTNE
jgi:integrase